MESGYTEFSADRLRSPVRRSGSSYLSIPERLASFALLLLSGILLNSPVQGEPPSAEVGGTRLNPPIVAVQLYAGQAMVRRVASVELKPGPNEFVLDDLPGSILDDSVRVSVDGDTVKLEEVRMETDHQRIFRSEEAKEAEQLLRQAESRLRLLSDRYASYQEEQIQLSKIQAGPAPAAPDRRSLEPTRWQTLLDFQQEALRRNHEATEKVLEEVDSAREEVAVALVVAERYRSVTSLNKKRLTISLQAKGPEKREISFEYRIAGASWFPIYSARVLTTSTSDRAKVRLAAYALVKNETGEDWKHIRLGLSAADPDESARLPVLAEWHIKPVLIETNEEADRRPSRGMVDQIANEGPSQRRRLTESPAAQSIIRADEKASPNAPEVNAPAKPSPSKRKEDLVQQKLDTQTNRTREYFAKNNDLVKDERARQKTEKVQSVLGEFQTNMIARDQAVQQGNFNEALRRSELVLGNIGNLDGRYRRFFKEEEEKSLRVKRQSLDMLDAQRFTSRLISPLQAARGFDYRYETKEPENIRSDGAFRKIFLFEKELDADLFYESVPGQKPLAFLVGETRHTDPVPLLAGPVSVFHNTDYVGESSLASVSSKDPFLLHLGADEEIKVERTERNYRETEGLLSRNYSYRYEVTLTVKNRRRKPSSIMLFDRIPVPSDERVRVTDVKIDPDPLEKNDYGLLRFRLTLKPGEEKKVHIKYRLIHPADVVPVFQEAGSPRM